MTVEIQKELESGTHGGNSIKCPKCGGGIFQAVTWHDIKSWECIGVNLICVPCQLKDRHEPGYIVQVREKKEGVS